MNELRVIIFMKAYIVLAAVSKAKMTWYICHWPKANGHNTMTFIHPAHRAKALSKDFRSYPWLGSFSRNGLYQLLLILGKA